MASHRKNEFHRLKTMPPTARAEALWNILEFGGSIAPWQRQVMEVASLDPSAEVRRSAFSVLGSHELDEDWTRPLYLRGLRDPDHDVRRTIAASLGDRGIKETWAGIWAIPALIERLDDRHPEVSSAALWSLNGFRRRELLSGARRIDTSECAAGGLASRFAASLIRIGVDRSPLPDLEPTIDDADPLHRRAATLLLGLARGGGSELLRASSDPDEWVRVQVCASVDAHTSVAPAILSRLLDDPEETVVANALQALARRRSAVDATLGQIRTRMSADSAFIRFCAINALGKLGRNHPDSLGALIERLDDPDERIRGSALSTIPTLGSGSIDAIEFLIKRSCNKANLNIQDEKYWIAHIVNAASEASPSRVLDVLMKCLESENSATRSDAVQLLRDPSLEPLMPVQRLMDLLDDPDPEVRASTAWALWDRGDGAQVAIPALLVLAMQTFDDPQATGSRVAAIDLIGRLAAPNSTALDGLRILLDAEDPAIRNAAGAALDLNQRQQRRAASKDHG